ncbi:MAG: ATP-binding protein, partial [Planctomycetaceae bacterium]|nr:ATP-binding protein [Planctomycetaceae bacterium]
YTEKAMQALFNEAEKHEQVVIFLDEIQMLLGKSHSRAVSVFLTRTDGIEKRKNSLLLLGATNDPEKLHDAVYRRLKNMIFIPMPDRDARRRIFEIQFEVPAEDLDYDKADFPLDEFADRSVGFSGADIADICVTNL